MQPLFNVVVVNKERRKQRHDHLPPQTCSMSAGGSGMVLAIVTTGGMWHLYQQAAEAWLMSSINQP
jgi:hypothetical protein